MKQLPTAKDSFWFSFAVGSTGGLLFSIVALIVVMPIFLKLKTETEKDINAVSQHKLSNNKQN